MIIALASVVGLALVAGVAVSVFVDSTHPPKPGRFYEQPSPLPDGPPGAILRTQAIADPPAGSRAWKVLYLSKSYTGRPTAVSGLLFVSTTPPPAGAVRNVVAVTHGTVGVASNCAVSNGRAFWPHIDGLSRFMRAGDAVVVPDYQGLGTRGPHPYLIGDSEAWGTLDAVRATHRFTPARAGTRFVAWGASQGGHAALFTGQQAASYAPELKLAGVAAAAPATDLVSLFHANGNSTFGRVLSAYTLDMWSRVYPQLRLDQVVTRFARPMVKRISTICLLLDNGPIAAGVVGQALRISYLRRQPWETEPWKGLLVRNSPGAAQIPAPVIITQGGADGIVHPPVTAYFARRLCRRSAAVAYRGYPGVNHLEAGARAAPEVVRWIADRFAGRPAPTTCGARAEE